MKRREFLKSAAAAGAAAVLTTPERGEVASAATKPDAESLKRLYPLGPDSKPQPGVPKGSTFSFSMEGSNYFPGTTRTIDVYVPDQYAGAQPACVWVSLDRLMDSLPTVFDNLIHKKQMPVTIAVGLHPGTVASSDPPQNPRFNRSFEFDSLTDVLARFILEEVLPAVEKRKTARDLPIRLSRDPNDCGITGGSSGGIGAFTVAWQRPDAFRRVYSMIGTWVGMRGGDRYPVLVRKTEPKPLRIFLQDGSNDGWPGGLELGDWWMGNQEMERSLTFAGYEVNHAWGMGGHDGYQGESILPDVMRWLWKDWPNPVEAGQTQNFAIQAIAKPEEAWEKIGKHSQTATHTPSPFPKYASLPVVDANSTAAAITADRQGNLYMQNPSDGLIFRIVARGSQDAFARVHPGDNGLAFGADGKLYVAEIETARILALDMDGKMKVVAEGIRGHRLIATHEGNIYLTEAAADRENRSYSGKVWLLSPDGSKRIVADQLNGPAGIALAPDGLWLYVAESNGHHAYSYRVEKDGSLQDGEPTYWYHVPDSANDCGAMQICMDRQGWTYAATRMGIQAFDRNGRVTAIFPLPGNAQAAGVCFGGADFQTLYVTTGNAIYRRRVKTTGIPSFEKPIVLPAWRAG